MSPWLVVANGRRKEEFCHEMATSGSGLVSISPRNRFPTATSLASTRKDKKSHATLCVCLILTNDDDEREWQEYCELTAAQSSETGLCTDEGVMTATFTVVCGLCHVMSTRGDEREG